MPANKAWIAIAFIIGIIIGVCGGYFGKPSAPAKTVTSTVTVTKTVTTGAGGATKTVTVTTTSTITKAVQKVLTTLPKSGTIVIRAWCGGAPPEYYRAKNLERAAEVLNTVLKALGTNLTIVVKARFEHIPKQAAKSKLMAAWQAKQAPDIVIDYGYSPIELIKMGWALPLDDYYKEFSFLFADVPPQVWKLTYKNHLWIIPQDLAMHVFYVRIDVLKKMGWSDDRIRKFLQDINEGKVTFQDIINVAVEAMKKGLVKYGIYHRKGAGGSLWIPYYSLGGRFYNPETGNLMLSKSKLLTYFTLFYNMTQVYKVMPQTMITTDWRKIHMDFVNGRVLFWMGGSWHWGEWQRVPYHEKLGKVSESWEREHIGFALYPATVAGAQPGAFVGVHGYMILKQSKYPALAFLIATLATLPAFEVDHDLTAGKLPVHVGTAGVSKFKEKGKFLYELSKLVGKTWPEWRPNPYAPKLYEILVEALTKVEMGQLKPADAVKLVIQRAQAEIPGIEIKP